MDPAIATSTHNCALIVDDDEDVGNYIKQTVQAAGFDTQAVTSADDFWSAFDELNSPISIIDLQMPGTDGIELLRHLGQRNPGAKVVIVSGTDTRMLRTAEKLGESYGLRVLGSVQKPFDPSAIEAILGAPYDDHQPITADDLRDAIATSQLVLHYQPKASLIDNKYVIDGVEALVRWEHPQNGLIMPDKFLPMCETRGMAGLLTNFVIAEAIEQAATWRTQGLNLQVAVNLSPSLLDDLTLPDKLADLIVRKKMTPDRFALEVTETGAMADVVQTMDILTRFRLKGFGLAMDDFGTGYSSMAQLLKLPFNELKIDKSFVLDLFANQDNRTIVEASISLAHKLGLTACAEGVETVGVLDQLKEWKCDKIQGFLVGRPAPAVDLESAIDTWECHYSQKLMAV